MPLRPTIKVIIEKENKNPIKCTNEKNHKYFMKSRSNEAEK